MTSLTLEEEIATPLSFSNIETSATNLKNEITRLRTEQDILESQDLREFAAKGIALRTDFRDFMSKVPRDDMDIKYPHRGDVMQNIRSIIFESLGSIEFAELSEVEQDDYISAMVEMNREFFDKHESGYYYIGWPEFVMEIPEEYRNLKKIAHEYDATLTAEQEDDIYRYEEGRFKIHLTVPEDKKLDVMKVLLSALQGDNKIVQQIFEEKKSAGESERASIAEIREKGGRLASLITWKMKDFSHPEYINNADFVFYPRPGKDQSAEDALVVLVNDLTEVLSELDLPEIEHMPRYSTQVIKNGKNVPGLSFVQGNGDFKSYLLRTGGEEKLGRYYNPETNFAVRKDTNIIF